MILSSEAFARHVAHDGPEKLTVIVSPFVMIDHKSDPAGVEFGIGHGFTTASDAMALKLIRSRFLYQYGFQASARRPFNRIL